MHNVTDYIEYNKDTGEFTWKETLSIRAPKGSRAGTIGNRGYVVIRINKQGWAAGRLAWYMHYGKMPSGVIDHIDGNPTNNRISNLRDVPQLTNTRNNKISKNNTSGHPGVYYCKKRDSWYSQIGRCGKTISLGVFKTKEEAVAARKSAEIEHGYIVRTS